jgi:hypothetical protein
VATHGIIRSIVGRAIAHLLIPLLILSPLRAEALIAVADVAAEGRTLAKDAWGNLLNRTGTDPQPYAFAGEPYDPNIGFQYLRARWYTKPRDIHQR